MFYRYEKNRNTHTTVLSMCLIKNTKDGSKKMWRCDQKHNGCKARLHTDALSDAVVEMKGAHTHGNDAAGVEIARAITAMKRRASDTQEGNVISTLSIIFYLYGGVSIMMYYNLVSK